MAKIHPWLPNQDYWENNKEFKEIVLKNALSTIPSSVREKAILSRIPAEPSEPWKVEKTLLSLIKLNVTTSRTFAGGVVCPHFVHPVVEAIVSRGEFLTAYTPYQPEINQGALQALYEFQSIIAELYGVDVVNSGMYDGASALGEAAGLAFRVTKKKTIILPHTLMNRVKKVVETYVYAYGGRIIEYDPLEDSPLDNLEEKGVLSNAAAVVVENPLGTGEVYHRLSEIAEASHSRGALVIAFQNPLLAAVVRAPGELGADIVVGEGQALGLPMNLGGPLLGILGVRGDLKLVRSMPGRIIGATVDKLGRRAYAMILQTREQHIRRERATSNITTNTALNAIAAAVSVALMGRRGIRRTAFKVIENSNYLKEKLEDIDGLSVIPKSTVFGNVAFTINQSNTPAGHIFRRLYQEHGIVPFSVEGSMLVSCATEVHDKDEIEYYARLLSTVLENGGGYIG